MAIAFVGQAKAASSDNNTATISSVDSSGGSLHLVVVADYEVLSEGTMSSTSPSLSWNSLVAGDTAADSRCRIYWAIGAGGATMSYTYTRTGSFPAISAMWFSGADQSSPLRDQSHNNNVGSTLVAGTSSVGADTDVVIAGVSFTISTSPTINGGFSTPNTQDYVGATNWGVSASYLLTTAATNPTWSFGGTRTAASAIAAFKVASAGGAIVGSYYRRLVAEGN